MINHFIWRECPVKSILFKTKWFRGISITFALVLTSSIAYSGDIVPYTFYPGGAVSSSEMNSNFLALEDAIKSGIIVTMRENSSSGKPDAAWVSEVVTATCNSDEVLIGVNCGCQDYNFDPNTTNYGWLRYCSASGNGGIGGCAAGLEAYENLAGPPIAVQVFCAKKENNTAPSAGMTLPYPDNAQAHSEDLELELTKIKNEFLLYEQSMKKKNVEK